MKKAFVAFVILLSAASAFAADVESAPDHKTVLSFGGGIGSSEVEVRRTFMGGRVAAIGLLGYLDQSQKTPMGDFSQHTLQVGIGGRYNFALADQLRPFAQLDVSRTSGHNNNPCSTSPGWQYLGRGGIEYFFSRRVSVEGSAGLAYARQHETCAADTVFGSSTFTTVSTFRSGLALNFYF